MARSVKEHAIDSMQGESADCVLDIQHGALGRGLPHTGKLHVEEQDAVS